MKSTSISLLVGLVALAGCASPTEQQGIDAVAQFYGGTVSYTKGSQMSTNTSEPQGKYLGVTLQNNRLSKRYDNLQLPASNCAYLVYSKLTPVERQAYSYLKVNLKDSASAHEYTFRLPELQAATQATSNLTRVMTNLQEHKYATVADYLNPAAVGRTSPDSLARQLAGIGQQVGPFTDYLLQGYDMMSAPIASQPQQFVRLFVTAKQPGSSRNLLLVVNPRLRSEERFLYGISVLKQ